MDDQHIKRILAQVPGWNSTNFTITPLVARITNQNYRVDNEEGSFVLRIGGKGTQLLGIDRGREHICTAIAAQVGVGAEVVHFIAAEDALVTRFIFGAGISPETAAQPETLQRIVTSIKRYHAGPAFPGTFSPFTTVRNYTSWPLDTARSFPTACPR